MVEQNLRMPVEFEEAREFFDKEEARLIKEGHKGEYALVARNYESIMNILYIGDDKLKIVERFYREYRYGPCYCGKVGIEEIVHMTSPYINL